MITTKNQDLLREWLSNELHWELPTDTYCIGKTAFHGGIDAVIGFNTFINRSACIHSAGHGGHWISRALLHEVFYWPFITRGLEVLIGQVGSTNFKALTFNKHLGFKTQCVIPCAHEYGDLVIMTMLKEECRFIQEIKDKEMELMA